MFDYNIERELSFLALSGIDLPYQLHSHPDAVMRCDSHPRSFWRSCRTMFQPKALCLPQQYRRSSSVRTNPKQRGGLHCFLNEVATAGRWSICSHGLRIGMIAPVRVQLDAAAKARATTSRSLLLVISSRVGLGPPLLDYTRVSAFDMVMRGQQCRRPGGTTKKENYRNETHRIWCRNHVS